MTLVPGARLGEYEIVSAIGAGGMGEVYRARDTSLGREVAIKVLPSSFAADPDRLARFGREARLLASLNHPAIATLHGFHTEADTRFLVMELVEGETLADRLQRGPLPVREALDLFIAIARGLEAAHEKGVIHRDLKPANLKLPDGSTGDTRVKILDFGLAKAMTPGADSDAAPLTHSPTLTLAATLRGEVLGTAAYMSPEQAKGRPVDRRTDIFAFGACLYEALTGRRAFDGDNVNEIMAAVLKVEPDLDALPVEVGPALRRLLRRCLTKDPAERLHDIADARLELQRIARDGDEETTVASAARRPAWLGAGVSAIAGALLGAGLVLLRGGSGRADPPLSYLNLALPSGQRLAHSSGGSSIAISADGRHIVYAGRDDSGTRLYHRSLDGTQVTPLPGTEEASSVSFSPDGAVVAFARGETLLTVGLDGESPRRVTEALLGVRGVAWDAAGRLLFGERGGTLHRIARDGGEAEAPLAKVDTGDHRLPEPVSGRNAVVFLHSEFGARQTLQVVDLDDGEVRDLTAGTSPRFLSPEVLLWVREGSLWAGRFDAQVLALRGEPRRVVSRLATSGLYGQYDVSDNGTLVYASGSVEVPYGLFWVDRQGRRTSLGLAPGDYYGPELSPDGSALLVQVADQSGLNTWTLDLERGVLSRLTFGGFDVSSTWSADGRRVYYSSLRDAPGIYSRAADGTGEVTTHYRAETADGRLDVADATPDGSGLILVRQLEEQRDILYLALTESSKPRPLLAESYSETNPELSPDGRWLAYASNESGTWQVYVRPYPDVASGKSQVSTAGGRDPAWSPDGNELFFHRGRELRSVAVESAASFRAGPEHHLVEVDTPLLTGVQYDVHPDGRFIALTDTEDGDREPPQIVVIERFDREVERLLARP